MASANVTTPAAVAGAGVLGDTSGESDDCLSVLLGDAGDPDGRLAHDRLPVKPSLAGDHDVGIPYVVLKPRLVQHDLDAGLQNGVCEGQKRKAQAARGAGAGVLLVCLGEGSGGEIRVVGEPLVHLQDHRRRGALLRTVDRAGSVLAAEGIRHIAGDFEGALRKLRDHVPVGDLRQILEPLRAEWDLVPLAVQHPEAQGLEHPHAAVIGGAAADAHDEAPAPLFYSVPNDLTHAVGGGVHGVALRVRNERDARRARHLHDRRPRLVDDTVDAFHRPSHGARHGDRFRPAAHAQSQRLNRAFAAVGQRPHRHPGRRIRPEYPLTYGLPGLQGGEGALQGVDRHCYLHVSPSFLFRSLIPSSAFCSHYTAVRRRNICYAKRILLIFYGIYVI